jgi:DNA repair exonuclease SbcCD nuclease subunit
MLRLLHFADLHLDRAFGGQSYVGCDGAQRRTLLRTALQWAVDLALEREADAVTIGGDLFELEHVTSDSAAYVSRQLGRLKCPVLVAAGNHDYSSPASPYRTTEWPANVTLALEPRPTRLDLGEVVLWAVGYAGREMDPAVLRTFDIPADDLQRHILVLHGVDLSTVSPDLRWGGLGLRADKVREIGFQHVLLGHIHQGQVGELMSWPGSPVPLDAGEAAGGHGALWVEVDDDGLRVEAVPADLLGYDTASVDVTDVSDSTQLENQLRKALEPLQAADKLVTCRLWGRRRRGLTIDPMVLAASIQDLARGVRVIDATAPEIDLEDLAREPNARGQAVARLLADGSAPALWAANLIVEAFEGDLVIPG